MEWLFVFVLAVLVWGFYRGYTGSSGARRWASGVRQGSSIVEKIKGPGFYEIDVVGESHYQRALERICGGRTEDGAQEQVEASLLLEDDNPHDNMAVRIDIEGHTVGYLSRDVAREYRKWLIDMGMHKVTAKCDARIVGGWDRGGRDRGHFGVQLDLPL